MMRSHFQRKDKSMKITREYLVGLGASCKQLDTFSDEWPDGAEITLDNCLRAAELGLDLDWLAKKMFPAPAWEAYLQATAPALEAYERAKAPAWEAFEKARATALEAYEQAIAPAFYKIYDEIPFSEKG